MLGKFPSTYIIESRFLNYSIIDNLADRVGQRDSIPNCIFSILLSIGISNRDFFPRQRKFPVNIRRRFNSFRHGSRVRMFEWPQLMPVNQKRHVVAAINKSVPPLVCIFTGDYFKAPRAQIHATDEEVVDALTEWRMQLIPGPRDCDTDYYWYSVIIQLVVGDLQSELWTQSSIFISNTSKIFQTRSFCGFESKKYWLLVIDYTLQTSIDYWQLTNLFIIYAYRIFVDKKRLKEIWIIFKYIRLLRDNTFQVREIHLKKWM